MSDLLYCPFCGGESAIQCDEMHTAYGATGIKEARAICEDCGASSAYCTTRGGALALWNSRAYSVTGDERGDTTVIVDETQGFTDTVTSLSEAISLVHWTPSKLLAAIGRGEIKLSFTLTGLEPNAEGELHD